MVAKEIGLFLEELEKSIPKDKYIRIRISVETSIKDGGDRYDIKRFHGIIDPNNHCYQVEKIEETTPNDYPKF